MKTYYLYNVETDEKIFETNVESFLDIDADKVPVPKEQWADESKYQWTVVVETKEE